MLKNKEPAEQRKPFTDIDGKELKACQTVEILNGTLPGYAIMAKVLHPCPWESTIEYDDRKKGVRNVSNEILKIRVF